MSDDEYRQQNQDHLNLLSVNKNSIEIEKNTRQQLIHVLKINLCLFIKTKKFVLNIDKVPKNLRLLNINGFFFYFKFNSSLWNKTKDRDAHAQHIIMTKYFIE